MDTHFSIQESLRLGWRTTREHSALVFQIVLSIFGVQVAQQIVSKVLGATFIGSLATLVLFIVSIVVDVGAVVISLKLVRGQEASYADIVPSWRIIRRYVCVGLLLGCLILIPLLLGGVACFSMLAASSTAAAGAPSLWALLAYASTPSLVAISIIIPTCVVVACYLMLRYAMAAFCVVDGKEVMQSLHESAKLTYGEKWHLFAFMLVGLVLYVLGIVALLIGLLIAIPIVMLAYAHIYTQLQKHVEQAGEK